MIALRKGRGMFISSLLYAFLQKKYADENNNIPKLNPTVIGFVIIVTIPETVVIAEVKKTILTGAGPLITKSRCIRNNSKKKVCMNMYYLSRFKW